MDNHSFEMFMVARVCSFNRKCASVVVLPSPPSNKPQPNNDEYRREGKDERIRNHHDDVIIASGPRASGPLCGGGGDGAGSVGDGAGTPKSLDYRGGEAGGDSDGSGARPGGGGDVGRTTREDEDGDNSRDSGAAHRIRTLDDDAKTNRTGRGEYKRKPTIHRYQSPAPCLALGCWGLAETTTEDMLTQIFSEFGPLKQVCLIYDRQVRAF
jgi:hypothetical protein